MNALEPFRLKTASQKRIATTHVQIVLLTLTFQAIGEVWDLFRREASMIRDAFLRTGCLIRTDHVDDELIIPQNFPVDYYLRLQAEPIEQVCYELLTVS